MLPQLQEGTRPSSSSPPPPASSRARAAPRRACSGWSWGENLGFARAANAGLREAQGEAVLLLNDDTRPLPGFVDALREAAQTPGIHQPRILLLDGGAPGQHRPRPLPRRLQLGRGREDLDGQDYDAEAASAPAPGPPCC
ncbi:MAG: glycosyltransferase [Alphaproteobacteria bacterium]|nr:glycosyltransferase [Alphaproteobacteria bacterium]